MGRFTDILSKLFDGDEAAGGSSVAAAFEAARVAGVKVELVPLLSSNSAPMTARVLQVAETSIIIEPPVRSGSGEALRRTADYRITVPSQSAAQAGETRMLERTRLNVDGRTVRGYRMELPRSLNGVDRRDGPRAFPSGGGTEARLQVLGRSGPVYGMLEDLSPGGARIRCRNAPTDITSGTSVVLQATMPDPIGAIDELGTIVGAEGGSDGGETTVRVRFRAPNDVIAQGMRKKRA